MADQSFSRLGQPVRVPFSATSAGTPFNMRGKIPQLPDGTIRNDLTFTFTNETGYDVRLEGTPQGATFVPVTEATGWSILARSNSGTITSKKPMNLSVQAFSTNGNPIPPGADFTGCFIELTYGTGR